ncbi:MAG TPA: hypothetical protein VG347_05250 [Verrucomicrobiae bacterium]|nr:hypothetical protein [Verrucomicrobiae bacterium]
MKTAFDFQSRRVTGAVNLSQPVQFLPGGRAQNGLNAGVFTAELMHLPLFMGVSSFYAEKLTMAQPLLKGELR